MSFLYPDHHLSPERLQSLRFVADSLADEALAALEEYSSTSPSSSSSSMQQTIDAFLENEIVSKDERLVAFKRHLETIPHWLDYDLLRRGQIVYLAHSASASIGLLYYSLLGGFSAPKIISVLESTGYLSSHVDSTYKRLLETHVMIVNCLEKDSLQLHRLGWKSVIKVRLLHARVRKIILSRTKNKYDVALNGIPINEEDMMATLLSFSALILHTIDRIGSSVLCFH